MRQHLWATEGAMEGGAHWRAAGCCSAKKGIGVETVCLRLEGVKGTKAEACGWLETGGYLGF